MVSQEVKARLSRRAQIEALSSPTALVLSLLGYIVPRLASDTAIASFTLTDFLVVVAAFAVSSVGATWFVNSRLLRTAVTKTTEGVVPPVDVSAHDDIKIGVSEKIDMTCSVFVAVEGRPDTPVLAETIEKIQHRMQYAAGAARESPRPDGTDSPDPVRKMASAAFGIVMETTFIAPNPIAVAYEAARVVRDIARSRGVHSSIWLVSGSIDAYRSPGVIDRVAKTVIQMGSGSIALVGSGVDTAHIHGIKFGPITSIRLGSGHAVTMIQLQKAGESN